MNACVKDYCGCVAIGSRLTKNEKDLQLAYMKDQTQKFYSVVVALIIMLTMRSRFVFAGTR